MIVVVGDHLPPAAKAALKQRAAKTIRKQEQAKAALKPAAANVAPKDGVADHAVKGKTAKPAAADAAVAVIAVPVPNVPIVRSMSPRKRQTSRARTHRHRHPVTIVPAQRSPDLINQGPIHRGQSAPTPIAPAAIIALTPASSPGRSNDRKQVNGSANRNAPLRPSGRHRPLTRMALPKTSQPS